MTSTSLLHLEVLRAGAAVELDAACAQEPHLSCLAADHSILSLQVLDAQEGRHVGVLQARCFVLMLVLHSILVLRGHRKLDSPLRGLMSLADSLNRPRANRILSAREAAVMTVGNAGVGAILLHGSNGVVGKPPCPGITA